MEIVKYNIRNSIKIIGHRIMFSFIGIFMGYAVILSVQAADIEKCQDENGEWHYGNFAADECALSSDITSLNEEGTEVGTKAPPPTMEELAKAEAARLAEEVAAAERKKQREDDTNVVRIFGSEEVIISTRDRKLASIDNNIEITRQIKDGVLKDIESLKVRPQTAKVKNQIKDREVAIQSYDVVIEQSLFEREKLLKNYIEILESFRGASERLGTGG